MSPEPGEVDRVRDLPRLQEILAAGLSAGGDRYFVHPGDLAWWVHHEDPRIADRVSYWRLGDRGLVVLGEIRGQAEISAFAVPGEPVVPLIEWGQERLGHEAEVGWVSTADAELVDYLRARSYEISWTMPLFERDPSQVPARTDDSAWELRHLRGEEEAGIRRETSYLAFRSTMTPEDHLDRYLRFMRSPVYDLSRDLVAVAPDGRIASFMVWWPDQSGIAQIEPFGTHPEYQRQGAGRALMRYGLVEMAKAGMDKVRVCTETTREDAVAFYEAVGFARVGLLGWWRPAS